jgi:hypothetical protein
MSTTDDARIAIISNSSNIEPKNIFYLGTIASNMESYVGTDQNMTISKIATFRNDGINLRVPVTIYGDLFPSSNIYSLGSEHKKWHNLLLSGCNFYFNKAILNYDPMYNNITFKYINQTRTEYAQVTAKNINIYSEDRSYAILSTSEYGTLLTSYNAETDLISSLNLTALNTNHILEGSSNLYFTFERARTVIESSGAQLAPSVINTCNILINLAKNNEYVFMQQIDNYIIHTSNDMSKFADHFSIDYLTIVTEWDKTSNTIDNLMNNMLSIFPIIIIQRNADASNYLQQTCDQILSNIGRTSTSILSDLYIASSNISNLISLYSNDIIFATQQTSNKIAMILKNDDSNIQQNITITSNNLYQFCIDTSNLMSSNIISTSHNIIRYADNTSNILVSNIVNTSNQIILNTLGIFDIINQTSNYLITNINVLSSIINNVSLDDVQNGITKKFIVDNVYDNDLTVSNLTTQGHVLPSSNGVYNLGISNNRWKDLYLSGNTIHLGSAKISVTQNDGIQIRNQQNQLLDIVVSKVLIKDSITSGYNVIQSVDNIINFEATAEPFAESLVYTTSITEGSNQYFTYARTGGIAYASNLLVIEYTTDTSNRLNTIINQLTTDKISEGTSNKFIVNRTYASDLSVYATLYVSNLQIKGSNTNIQTNDYITEMLSIDTYDSPALKVIQNGIACNIAEFYSSSNPVLIITNQGNIGIGKTNADEKIDLNGNIKFGMKINDVTAFELSHLSGITWPIQPWLLYIDAYNSNITSNFYFTQMQSHDVSSNMLATTITKQNENMLQYISQIAQNFSNTSNEIMTYALLHNDDLKSYLNSSVTNIIQGAIESVSGVINDQIDTTQIDLNSYITNTSNNLMESLSDISNSLMARVNNIDSTGWQNTSSNIIFQNNVSIGSNVFGSEALIVVGNINFSASINDVNSNQFSHLNGVTSSVQLQLNSTLQGLLDYTSNTSNAFISLFDVTSNSILQRQATLGSNVFEYMNWVSNDFMINVNTTSNNLNSRINTFLSGFVPSQWSNIGNNIYYTLGNVGIGTSIVDNNKLEVYGDINIVGDYNLKKTLDDGVTVVNYQLERWKDSFTYDDATGTKYIYYNDGYVGINKTTPTVNLHVGTGSYNTGTLVTCNFISGSTSFSSNNTGITNVCAIFDSALWCKSAVASASDIRIKKNIYDINDDRALQKIMMLEPKTYDYIDPLKGTNKVYGFIAQQVREVLPEAVGLHTEVVPNIFVVADCSLNIVFFVYDQSLVTIGTRLCIISLEGVWGMYTVLAANGTSITVDKNIAGDRVFVYGIEVNDFHTLDKSYIYTLNVCATQILSREIDTISKQVEALEQQLGITSNSYIDWMTGR